MAVAFVDATSAFLTDTAAVPSGSAGDVLAAFGIDVTDPPDGSWTLRDEITGLAVPVRLWTKTRGSSEGSTYTFGGAGAQPIVHVLDLSGATEAPLAFDSAFNTSATITSPSVAVPTGGSLFVLFQGGSGVTTTSNPAGMTEREDNSDTIETWTEARSAGATGTRSTNLSGSSFWLAMVAVWVPRISGTIASAASAQTSAIAADVELAAAIGSVAAPAVSAIEASAELSGSVASVAEAATSAIDAALELGAAVASVAAEQESAIAGELDEVGVVGSVASVAAEQESAIGAAVETGAAVASVAAEQESAIEAAVETGASVGSVAAEAVVAIAALLDEDTVVAAVASEAAEQESAAEVDIEAGGSVASVAGEQESAIEGVVLIEAAIGSVVAEARSNIRVREPGAGGGGVTKVVQHGGRFGVAHAIIRWGRERFGGDHHAAP